jgi:hypothetical protein
MFERDHYPIRKVDGGKDVHWNLTWRLKAEHRYKTAKVDIPAIAKDRAIARAALLHLQRMLLKGKRKRIKVVSRWPKRKIRSRRM